MNEDDLLGLQKLTQIRGRKLSIIIIPTIKLFDSLQKLTQIRGRKLSIIIIPTIKLFDSLQKLTQIRGRKPNAAVQGIQAQVKLFTKVNPDKGTETVYLTSYCSYRLCLQKLTPIRGRKQRM